jgi:hypothetical protein
MVDLAMYQNAILVIDCFQLNEADYGCVRIGNIEPSMPIITRKSYRKLSWSEHRKTQLVFGIQQAIRFLKRKAI